MTEAKYPQPDLFPCPPIVAYHYGRAVEISLREGDRCRAHAAVDQAFDSAKDFGPMPDEVGLSDVIQSERFVRELAAGKIDTVGQLCRLRSYDLRDKFGFSDQAIDQIRSQLEEVGRKLEG